MIKRKHLTNFILIVLAALTLLIGLGPNSALAQKLYLGDAGDDSVKVVDLTSKTVDYFVSPGSGGLLGPRGILFREGNLLVVSQNPGQPYPGDILSYNGPLMNPPGGFQGPLVPNSDPNAPFGPRGIILGK
jgi:hypothetical protein